MSQVLSWFLGKTRAKRRGNTLKKPHSQLRIYDKSMTDN